MSLQHILLVTTDASTQVQLPALVKHLEQDAFVSVEWLSDPEGFQEALRQSLPDMVLIDLASWDENDPRVVERLCLQVRESCTQHYRPVVVLLSHEESEHQRIEYFVLGADDIVNGLLSLDELRVRLLAHLRRHLALLSHPATQLPNLSVFQRLLFRKLQDRGAWALLCIRIRGGQTYLHNYGEVPMASFQRQFSRLLSQLLVAPDWASQATDDEFWVMTTPEKAERIASILCRRFEQLAPGFYTEQDKELGYAVEYRQGVAVKHPLMSLGIGVLHSEHQVGLPVSIASLLGQGQQLAYLACQGAGNHWVSDRHRLEAASVSLSATEAPLQTARSRPSGGLSSLALSRRALVYESDAALAYLLHSVLGLQGWEVEAVNSPCQLADLLKKSTAASMGPEKTPPVSLVILDPQSEMGAWHWEVCREIKAFSKDTYLVVCSDVEAPEMALAWGADCFMTKPFDLMTLLNWTQPLLSPVSGGSAAQSVSSS
jgi:DNA-binding response OmpR family regulator